LDEVRYIGNFSRGGFGARIVTSFLDLFDRHQARAPSANHHVWHLRAEDARRPTRLSNHYPSVSFDDYDDNAGKREHLLINHDFAIVFLAAALSDDGPDRFIEGKIPSDEDELTIHLKRHPKLIQRVRGWSQNPDCIQVGFKLLYGVSEEELVRVARESGSRDRSDFTLANDSKTLLAGRHKVFLVCHPERGHEVEEFPVTTQEQVDVLVRRIIELSGMEARCALYT
jgi:phosphopantothenoylcysteine synthetase/decarboxylase